MLLKPSAEVDGAVIEEALQNRAEFVVAQVRAMDASKSGAGLGLPLILSFCSAILGRSLKGGLLVAGGISIGGSIEPIYNAINIAELAVEKGAQLLMLPVSARRQLNDLSDDTAAKLAILYYIDVRDAVNKALAD